MKEHFKIFRENPGLTYLDTAASAQKPDMVLHRMNEFSEKDYSNVHRSAHVLAERATQAYEDARETMAAFINASPDEIIFTSGTTGGINLVAHTLGPNFNSGDEIIVTMMEHHSNFVPWQKIAEQYDLTFKVLPLTPDYRLDIGALESMLSEKTRVVALNHVSNVLGTINDVKSITSLVRKHAPSAYILVDGAQAVPHMPVDVKDLDVDFYAFSGHKMYGPTGTGVLYGKNAILKNLEPAFWGGEMVDTVTVEKTTATYAPAKFEPGTPNIVGVVGLAAAVKFLREIGFKKIHDTEHQIIEYALKQLSEIAGLSIIGPQTTDMRSTAIAFTLKDWHPHDLSEVLSAENVAVRAGHHCTQPLHCSLGLEFQRSIGEGTDLATTRASIGIYNTREDIDRLVEAIDKARVTPADPSEILLGDSAEDELIKMDITDHAIHPRNRRKLDNHDGFCIGKNPNCGDIVNVYLTMDGDSLRELTFEGSGCAISQAAMSKLTKKLPGMTRREIEGLGLEYINELVGLDFSTRPVRAKCAMLGLRATQCAIKGEIDET